MTIRSLAIALAATSLCLASCASAPEPVRDESSLRVLPSGPVVGAVGEYGSHVWLGIPYAKPPVGPLRWRAPQPAERWAEPRVAMQSGQACSQFGSVFAGASREDAGKFMGDEDCLYLDVYAPRLAPEELPEGDARLPVMLWIHGGGNVIGQSSFYDGGRLAVDEKVVVVAIQYRLGPLGWLRHESLRSESQDPADRSGNFGTLDMIRALQWVRENISAFGGDPSNVTIFGESAGGTDVFSLLLSPRSKDLFQRAIVQSGSTRIMEPERAEAFHEPGDDVSENSSNEILLRLLQADGSAADATAARAKLDVMSSAQVAAYLRAQSAQELLAAYAREDQEGLINVPTVFRDGFVLPDAEPLELLARGEYHAVPVMLGTNRDETKIFMVFDPEYTSVWFGAIPRAHDPDLYDASAEHQSNAWKAGGVDTPAALMHAVQGDSVFAYRWDWDEEPSIWGLYDGSRMVGAAHGLEIAFVFGHFDLGPQSNMLFTRGNREDRELLSGQMMSYWAEFARTGNPGRGGAGELPLWWSWDESNARAPKYMVLATAKGQGLRMDTRLQTIPGVVAAVLADERLPKVTDKCRVLRVLKWRRYITSDEYRAVGDGLCRAYAIDDDSW